MLVNLNAVLKPAQENGYAVGLFNTTDTDMLQAAIEAAEELRSPIVIGTAEVLLPHGELELISPSILHMARNASVPVVVHYDHGLTFERCMQALRLGFSSVMFDGSANSYEENLAGTREIVKIAHSFGASVEGEIGHVGNNDGTGSEADSYTTPEEAAEYLAQTGVDALAVAIGTTHGAYRKKPKLDFDRLQAIRQRCSAPLVLHGGSGLSDDDFRMAIRNGIAKVNIFTDLCLAGNRSLAESLANGESYLDARNKKVDAIKEEVKKKMLLFGCDHKA